MLHGKNCISEHLFLYIRCQCGMDNFPISNVFMTQLKLLETQTYDLMKLFLDTRPTKVQPFIVLQKCNLS